MLLLHSPSLLTYTWWFCASQPPPQKERDFICLFYMSSYFWDKDSFWFHHLPFLPVILLCHLCCHPAGFFFACMFSCMSFVQICHHSLSLWSCMLFVYFVFSSVIKYLYVVTNYAISGTAVLQQLAIAPSF